MAEHRDPADGSEDRCDSPPAGDEDRWAAASSLDSDESPPSIPQHLPQPAVGRLSLYYRELRRLLDAEE